MTERQSQRLKKKFLEVFAQIGNVTSCAREVGVLRNTVYSWRADDPEFAAAMDVAGDEAVDLLELEARRRGHDGYDKPVFQQGVQVGLIREYSDTLLIFLLKGLRPEKYREKPPTIIDVNAQSGAQIYLPERKPDA